MLGSMNSAWIGRTPPMGRAIFSNKTSKLTAKHQLQGLNLLRKTSLWRRGQGMHLCKATLGTKRSEIRCRKRAFHCLRPQNGFFQVRAQNTLMNDRSQSEYNGYRPRSPVVQPDKPEIQHDVGAQQVAMSARPSPTSPIRTPS